ncbi:MAG: DUF1810 domain-containing protein [Candidatus Handelsmanbacteria bacterium]|nr:DUF1810 domain-containing protein [Candidatus Handelsmanbacteria bacterium]
MPPDTAEDPYNLRRFLHAQATDYSHALQELQSGRKRSHWMWYVFPQFDGLGRTPAASEYAIKSLAEARAYIWHPVLGPRLIECTQTVLAIEDASLNEIFGSPDDLKFRSCMTLFELIAPDPGPFASALERFCAGQRDLRSLELIEKSG